MHPDPDWDLRLAVELRSIASTVRRRADDCDAMATMLERRAWSSARERAVVERVAEEAIGRALLESERVMVIAREVRRRPWWARAWGWMRDSFR